MFPRPDRPERPDLPNFRVPETWEELEGAALLVLAGLAIWLVGFWWGIALFATGFVIVVFVRAFNEVSADAHETRTRRRAVPPLARLHAVLSALVSGVLGFGLAASLGFAHSSGVTGILAVVATSLLLDHAVNWLLELDWAGARGGWCLLIFVWLPLSTPVAAYVAPGYEVHGLAANVATTALVVAATVLVFRASPWRGRWPSQADSEDTPSAG